MFITGIGSLLGTKGYKNALGVLLQTGTDTFQLEDDQSFVDLSINKGIVSNGFINDGFVVIASGVYEEGVLTVEKFELSEIETIKESR